MFTRRYVLSVSVLALGLNRAGFAQAQSFPDRLIKLVVPFPAGGPTDHYGPHRRTTGLVGPRSELSWSRIGRAPAARSDRRMSLVQMPMAIHCCWAARIPMRSTRRSTRISIMIRSMILRRLRPLRSIPLRSWFRRRFPSKTLQEFVGYLKDKPGKLICGAVLGIAPHVMVEYFKVVTGTKMVFVPYKGGATLIPDLLAGRIQMTFGAKSLFLSYIQSGKLRPLAVTSDTRWPELPDVPTMSESGFPNFPAYQWFVVLAPAERRPR